jgi:NAD(P)-dependent dehydrogenase (short-subunit alcohol dehydrogenase family)
MQGKNILIVGASTGIGAALAEMAALKGANIYTASRTEGGTSSVFHINFDAQTPDYQAFTQLPDILHGLVYCPGTINLKPFGRISADDFLKDFQINVLGAVGILQTIMPKLKRAEGASVVLFSTVAVQTGMGFHSSVAASKGAIEGLTRSLAAEFAMQKIRVNAIAPSLTDTPLAKQLLANDEKKEASNRRHPIGRYGTAQDVANAAIFLLGDESSWVTGQILGIDGGMGSIKMV